LLIMASADQLSDGWSIRNHTPWLSEISTLAACRRLGKKPPRPSTRAMPPDKGLANRPIHASPGGV